MSQRWQGRYEALEVVATGGEASLLRGFDHLHGRPVGLKVRRAGPAEEREALLREARVLLGLRPHPGLPLVREDFFVDGSYVVVMDWVEGTSLDMVVADRGDPGLTVALVLDWMDQLAAALGHLHGHVPRVVHGDVKPANTVLGVDGRVVLVDFGTAGSDASSGAVRGTPGFVAPEVAAGSMATPAADVYGLAATAFALLAGRPPDGTPPCWSQLEPAARPVIERALGAGLAVDPARRPASAAELVERMRAWAVARPAGRARRGRPADRTAAVPAAGPRLDAATTAPVGSPTPEAQSRRLLGTRPRRSTLVAVTAVLMAAMLCAGGVALIGGQGAPSTVVRLQGRDRYATAAAVARAGFPTAPVVVLARGDSFADAAVGSYLAGAQDGPVLLTAPGAVAPSTMTALRDMRTRQVFVVGDASAVSDAVTSAVQRAGIRVTRLAAPNRAGTAAVVAEAGGPAGRLGDDGPTALLANAGDVADILAAAPLAWRARFPLLLTNGNGLPPQTVAVLAEEGIRHVVVLGERSAVSAAVVSQLRRLGVSSQRLAGSDSSAEAVAIAGFERQALGWPFTQVALARDGDFPDALAGGPLAGEHRAPVLVAAGTDRLGTPTDRYLSGLAGRVRTMDVLGDATVVSDHVVGQAERAARIGG